MILSFKTAHAHAHIYLQPEHDTPYTKGESVGTQPYKTGSKMFAADVGVLVEMAATNCSASVFLLPCFVLVEGII